MKTKPKTTKTTKSKTYETKTTLDDRCIVQQLGGYYWVIGPWYADDRLQVLGPFKSRLLAKGWRDSPEAMCQLWDDERHGKLAMFEVTREHYHRVVSEASLYEKAEVMASAPTTAAVH